MAAIRRWNDEHSHALWEVVWFRGDDIYVRDCGLYLVDALELYDRLKGKRKGVTLRCKNVGFEPPLKYADHEPVYKRFRTRSGDIIRKRVGHRPVYPLRYTSRMMQVNRRGFMWCPYCMKFLKFEKRAGFETEEGIWVERPAYQCPICDVSSEEGNVKKFNPIFLYLSLRKRRKGRKRRRGTR